VPFELGTQHRPREDGVADTTEAQARLAKGQKGLTNTRHGFQSRCCVPYGVFKFENRTLLGEVLTVVGKPMSQRELSRIGVVDLVDQPLKLPNQDVRVATRLKRSESGSKVVGALAENRSTDIQENRSRARDDRPQFSPPNGSAFSCTKQR